MANKKVSRHVKQIKKRSTKDTFKSGRAKKKSKQIRLSHGDVPRGVWKRRTKLLPDPYTLEEHQSKPWLVSSKMGRPIIFSQTEMLLEAAKEYFNWCDVHPLYEYRIAIEKSMPKVVRVPRIRVYTIHGLCMYCNATSVFWKDFKNSIASNNQNFSLVIQFIEDVIYRQKFEAAACDLLNANIIGRDLGLADSIRIDFTMERKTTLELFPVVDDQEILDVPLQIIAPKN